MDQHTALQAGRHYHLGCLIELGGVQRTLYVCRIEFYEHPNTDMGEGRLSFRFGQAGLGRVPCCIVHCQLADMAWSTSLRILHEY